MTRWAAVFMIAGAAHSPPVPRRTPARRGGGRLHRDRCGASPLSCGRPPACRAWRTPAIAAARTDGSSSRRARASSFEARGCRMRRQRIRGRDANVRHGRRSGPRRSPAPTNSGSRARAAITSSRRVPSAARSRSAATAARCGDRLIGSADPAQRIDRFFREHGHVGHAGRPGKQLDGFAASAGRAWLEWRQAAARRAASGPPVRAARGPRFEAMRCQDLRRRQSPDRHPRRRSTRRRPRAASCAMNGAECGDRSDSHVRSRIPAGQSRERIAVRAAKSAFAKRRGGEVADPWIGVPQRALQRCAGAWIVDLPQGVRGGGTVARRLVGDAPRACRPRRCRP